MLEGRNLTFSYLKDDLVLENVSIQVKTGRIQTVLGPNGSGKTTLLLLVSGLLRPLSGEVLLDGKNLFEMLPGARRYIGIMFQNPEDQKQAVAVWFCQNHLVPRQFGFFQSLLG